MDVVVGDGPVDLYPRPVGTTCFCSSDFQPLDVCATRSSDYEGCGCAPARERLVPSLESARVAVAGEIVATFDVDGAVDDGLTVAEADIGDGDEALVLIGCWGEALVPLGGPVLAPPVLTEVPVDGGDRAEATAPVGAEHLHRCQDSDAVDSYTCCPLPLVGAVVQPTYSRGERIRVEAHRLDHAVETAAGTVRVWRRSSASTECCTRP